MDMASVKPIMTFRLGLRLGCHSVGILASSQRLKRALNSLGAPPRMMVLRGTKGLSSIDAARMAYSDVN